MTPSSTTTATPSRRHVALCPFPFSSHPASMLLLGRKIAATAPGVEISLFTTEPSASALSASLSQDEGSIRIRRVDSGLEAGAVHPVEAIRRLMEVAGESLRKGMAAAEEEVGVEIGCVVADAMMAFACGGIAEEKGVKWVALWTPSAGALVAHMFTDQLRKGVGTDGIEARKEEPVDSYIPGFPPVRIADLPLEILGVDYSFPVAQILHLMSLHLPKAAAVAINSFHPLEPATMDILNATFGNNNFLSAGPFALTMSQAASQTLSDPHACLPWLDTHTSASVVYIGFGSMHNPPPEEFTSLAEALEATRIPFLWSLPNRFKPYLPVGFEMRSEKSGVGKVVPWAPQECVLGHTAVGAHLSHCGWNSVMESVVSSVPLVCRPLGIADNMLNGRRAIREWGFGVEVEGGKMTKESTMVALERAMVGEEGRRAREKIGAMKRLAEEAVAEPSGSSTQNLRKFIAIITS